MHARSLLARNEKDATRSDALQILENYHFKSFQNKRAAYVVFLEHKYVPRTKLTFLKLKKEMPIGNANCHVKLAWQLNVNLSHLRIIEFLDYLTWKLHLHLTHAKMLSGLS